MDTSDSKKIKSFFIICVECNLPSQPADGIVSVSNSVHGQMANYTCDTGYTLFGLSSRLCLSDGTGWEGDDPTCSK